MTGRRLALIVANGEYDNEGLQQLSSPAADADALAAVLQDRKISDFDVQVVRNETAHVIQAQVEDLFLEGTPEDVLLLHFSCHGLKSESGELYFAARNTRPDRLGSTAVPADFVQRCMRVSRSRSIVLLLDCCYGGAFSQGVAVRASGEVNVLGNFPGGGLGGRGRAVITASNSIEYAFEGAQLAGEGAVSPSVFTSALVEGLRTGDADRDEDGWISLGELYEYLFDRVREQNPNQTPSRDIEMQGELYLARSRRKRVKPSPIPADLEAASNDPNMFTRLGAVTELRRRLGSEDLGVAVGAFEVLTRMVRTDIQNVAEAANAARRTAEISVAGETLRFGEVVQGTSPLKVVRVQGPPVAKAVTFEASHGWLRLTETAEGAEVSIDTGTLAELRGRIVVKGPTGEVVITVEATVVPEAVPEPVPEPEPELVPEPRPEPEPEPESEPEPEPEPLPEAEAAPAEEPPAPRTRLVQVSGWLGIVGGLFLVIGLIPAFYVNYDESYPVSTTLHGTQLYLLCLALLAMSAGQATRLTTPRSPVGPGLLAGSALAAFWGLHLFVMAGITLLVDHSNAYLGGGFYLLVVGLVALVVSGICALRVVALGFRRSGRPDFALLVVLGLICAYTVLAANLDARDQEADEMSVWSLKVTAAVLSLLIPILAVNLLPRLFGLSMLGGWAVGCAGMFGIFARGMSDLVYRTGLPVWLFGLAVAALVLGTLFVARKYRNEDQPIGGRSGP